MTTMRAGVWVLVAALAGASEAAAQSKVRTLGVMADAGVPDGAMASILYRPISAISVHGGVGHNAISTGVRVGVTVRPLSTWLSPTLSVDYGRYPEGDANPLVRMLTGDPEMSSSLLERIGYDFANAHVGLAFGRRRASFFVQGGASRTTATLHDDTTTANVVMWSVSARIGFVLYLY